MPLHLPRGQKLLLFDGVCNLCNSAVDFVIRNDKKNIFIFASLQSELGQELLRKYSKPVDQLDSFFLYDGTQLIDKSTAALTVAGELGGIISLVSVFLFLPVFLRDFIYSIVAKSRYAVFGRRESCRLPTAAEKNKFLQ